MLFSQWAAGEKMRHLSLAGSIVSIINTWTAVELSMVSVERVNEV